MLTTLYVLVSHALFDWSARKSPSGLAKNFCDIIQDSFGVSPDISSASSIYRGARMFYDLARKKNLKQSKGAVIKSEEVNLKAFDVEIEGGAVADKRGERGVSDVPNVNNKRKNFEDLHSRNKRARVKNVVDMLQGDKGLEEKVMEKLETRKRGKSDENFDIACLAVIKTLGISNKKYDDLRFWVQEMIRRNLDLSLMPTSRQLMERVQAEMVPPNMSCNSTGASIPLMDALQHTGGRFMLRLVYSPLLLS